MGKVHNRNESLSCFMDGELQEHSSIIDELSGCQEAKSYWLRCHLIRETLRDSYPARLSSNFSFRVMQALENEPTILNPAALRKPSILHNPVFKPIAGLAIAASVAAVTVVGIRSLYMPDTQTGFDIASTANPVEYAEPANSPALNLDSATRRVSATQGDETLNSYMLKHMEHSTRGHVQGMMPYVRLAGFEDGQ